MLSVLKTLMIGILSLNSNTLNNREYIKNHNSLNTTYKMNENQFIENEYINEFLPNQNNFIILNTTKNRIEEDKCILFKLNYFSGINPFGLNLNTKIKISPNVKYLIYAAEFSI